jgi:TRAP-type C4-dicarboxylate transport system permease small subunit
MNKVSEKFRSIAPLLNWVEDGFLCVLLLALVMLAFAQILLRNLFGIGLIWADPLLRQIVLWVAMIGAGIATRQYRHIHVNIIIRFLPSRVKAGVQALTDLFAAVICGLLVYSTWSLVMDEYQYHVEGNLVGGIPMWVAQAILPFAFTLISLRFLRFSILSFVCMIQGRDVSEVKGKGEAEA